MTPPPVWEPPGPGSWHLDQLHFPRAMTRFFEEVFLPSFEAGLAEASRRYGVPAGVAAASVGGRLFIALYPAEAHALARREQAAAAAIATKLWRADRDRWRTDLGPLLQRYNLALQRMDPSRMDTTSLRGHIAAAVDLFWQGARQHFAHFPASAFPVGDWAARTCHWTGASPADVFAALRGTTGTSAEPLQALQAVADAVCATGVEVLLEGGQGDPHERLMRLRGISPRIAAALDAYLEVYGHRVVTGFDLSDLTLLELPQLVLRSIAASWEEKTASSGPDAGDGEALDRLAERVPVAARDEFEEALAEALAGYGLHDEDMGIRVLWPLGLLRRALLAAGRRLTEGGVLQQPEHLLNATPAEVHALLGAPGQRPSGDELAQRTTERRRLSLLTPPLLLGVEEPPPKDLPPAAARMLEGFFFYFRHMDAAPTPPSTGTTLQGLAASRGRYTGRARVVNSPADFAKLAPGDVLIAWSTSPSYSLVLPLLGAVVTDKGGVLSHAAIVAREFGIPAVVGAGDATSRIPDGALVTVDGDRGEVEVVG